MKRWRRLRRYATRRALLAVCLAAMALAVFVLSADGGSQYDMPDSFSDGSTQGSQYHMPDSLFSDDSTQGSEDEPPSNLTADQLLDGLLTAEFGERSCRSRYEFAGYHKKTSHKPSLYLLGKLRKQEALQRRCGPGTAPYRTALQQLRSGKGTAATDCRYLVSISYSGLGNRMLAIASAFLYALLTERVLLVDRYNDVDDLFCEPFPGTTWLLPDGWRFPLERLRDYDINSKQTLGNMLKSRALTVGADGNTSWSDSDHRPPYVYLHLDGDYGFHDKLFYCDEHQRLLRGAPWLVMKTDIYLVPGMFLIPSFQDELGEMFSEKDAAFYHLGRYLFHPSNDVWKAVTSYYHSNLAGAGQRVGIQIRVFLKKQLPSQHVLDQVLSCVRREKILPEIKNTSDQAVLVTSLISWYYERIRDEYGGGKVAGGVHQPSHEERQRLGDTAHDMRALSEIYLLSTCDVLVVGSDPAAYLGPTGFYSPGHRSTWAEHIQAHGATEQQTYKWYWAFSPQKTSPMGGGSLTLISCAFSFPTIHVGLFSQQSPPHTWIVHTTLLGDVGCLALIPNVGSDPAAYLGPTGFYSPGHRSTWVEHIQAHGATEQQPYKWYWAFSPQKTSPMGGGSLTLISCVFSSPTTNVGLFPTLVTSGFSTFGYVAQGLGGLRPWVMPRQPTQEEDTAGGKEAVPRPPCVRAASVEPCMHSPSYYDCAGRRDVDLGKVVPYVRRCEDARRGIKLVNGSSL